MEVQTKVPEAEVGADPIEEEGPTMTAEEEVPAGPIGYEDGPMKEQRRPGRHWSPNYLADERSTGVVVGDEQPPMDGKPRPEQQRRCDVVALQLDDEPP